MIQYFINFHFHYTLFAFIINISFNWIINSSFSIYERNQFIINLNITIIKIISQFLFFNYISIINLLVDFIKIHY